ncbi:MAG: glycosyltransferase family 1 protein [Salinarimonadaceae bacterium]|nr:MAG: glycosyltransferase family 1 protein [Salinarimonadaceae bacterium]
MTLKILYVSADLCYTNPTGQMIPAVLDHVGKVTFFGPGFVPAAELSRGLQRFIDEHGPFDFAVTTELVALTAQRIEPEILINRVRRLYAFGFPPADLGFLPQIASQWRALRMPRLVSLLQDDLYNWSRSHVDLALASSDVMLGNGLENLVRIDEMRDIESEPWAARATDVFVDLVTGLPERFASFPLFVSDDEICRVPHFSRKNRWAVPGIQYRARRIAADELTRAGHRLRRKPPSVYVHKLAEWLGRMPRSGVALAQHLFRRELESARAVYTCGSVLRQPIRKFFEVPAAGALMVCEPCAGLTDYGFEDGLSCLMIAPNDVLQADRLLAGDPERAQAIARHGQRIVIEKHTIGARARQLAAVLDRLRRGSFAGARWSGGEYALADHPGEPSQAPLLVQSPPP